jgi:hypothetical protein
VSVPPGERGPISQNLKKILTQKFSKFLQKQILNNFSKISFKIFFRPEAGNVRLFHAAFFFFSFFLSLTQFFKTKHSSQQTDAIFTVVGH